MDSQKARKIGFASAISICFSSVVGIGIFLKNSSVGKNVDGNGISWLMTWIISGLIATALAYHFGKISRIDSRKGITGISGWTNEIVDEKNIWFKKIVCINYGSFYMPILCLSISFFCSEFFIDFIKTINNDFNPPFWTSLLITLCLVTFFILNNYFSYKFSGYVSLITSILKFIPLLLVIIIGLAFLNIHNLDANTQNGFDINISFDKAIQGIMLSVPSVLFAFDSFIGVGTWSKEVKGGEKTVSKVIVISMIMVTIIYALVCLSSIFHFSPEGATVLNVLVDSLPLEAKKGITIFVSLFIFISAFGTSNSVFGSFINESENLILNKVYKPFTKLGYRKGIKKASLSLLLVISVFWFLVIFIPSLIINSDAIIDGIMNISVIYMFLVYAYLIFLYWKSHYFIQHKTSSNFKKVSYSVFTWFSILLVIVVVLLNISYMIKDTFDVPYGTFSSWGLLLANSGLRNMDALAIYLSFSVVYIVFPLSIWRNRKSPNF